MDINKLKLLQALEECNKHIKRMLYAYHKMATLMPLDTTQYDHLTEEQVENLSLDSLSSKMRLRLCVRH